MNQDNDTYVNENDKQTTDDEACTWNLSIFRDCEGTIYFLWVYYIAIGFCLLMTICALGLLIYKGLFKKSALWNERMFEPIIGFLTWLVLCGIFRTVYMLIIIHDWIYTWFIFKSIVTSFGWLFGIFAIATYLVGVFKTVPKLAFHQRTYNSNYESQTTQKFLSNKSIALIYWSFVIIMGILTMILSCLKGYFQGIEDEYYFNVCKNTLIAVHGLSQLIGIYFFIKYGRLLVNLLNEAIQLLGANDNSNTLYLLDQYKTYLMKLKFINSLMVILCWFALLNILLAIIRKPLGKIVAFGVVVAAVTLIGSSIMMLASLGVIFHSEIYRQYSSRVMDLSSSIQLSEVSLDPERP